MDNKSGNGNNNLPVSPWVRAALAKRLPAKDLTRNA